MINETPPKKTKKWKIFLLGIVLSLVVGSLYLTNISLVTGFLYKYNSYDDNGISFKSFSIIDNYKQNPALETFDVSIDGGLKVSYRGYAVTYQPLFVMDSGEIYTWADIPSSIGKDLWRTKINGHKYKWGVDFSNVPNNIKETLKWVVLNRTSATKEVWNEVTNTTDIIPMTLQDIEGKIKIEDGTIIINNEVYLSHDDILRTYNIPVINRSMIVIGGLDNSWVVCDEWNEEVCIENHTEYNWKNNSDGTWNISFDPVVTINQEDWIVDSILTNITAEGGDSNFTHLNISNTAPYDNLILYMPFDGDAENTALTTHYDFSGYNHDGTGSADALINSTEGIYGDYLECDGTDDFVTTTRTAIMEPVNVTLMTWLKSTEVGNQYQYIVSKARTTSSNSYGIALNAVDDFAFYINDGGERYSPSVAEESIEDGNWHHLAGTYNETHVCLLWNGNMVGCTANTGSMIYSASYGISLCTVASSTTYESKVKLDEVMVFGEALTPAQILAIYNNQSARFFETGTQDIYNQSYMNISSGNNKVNVSTQIKNNMGSDINLTVGYYDGSWSATAPQTISSLTNYTFTISSTSTNLTLNYTFIAGNSTTSFYSPLILGDIIFETWSSGVEDILTLNITNPTTISPKSVSGLDNISINFDFQENEINITSGVTMDNVTIGGNISTILTTSTTEIEVINYSSFESDEDGWTFGTGDAARVNTQAHCGTWSAEIDDDTTESYIQKSFNLTGKPYALVNFSFMSETAIDENECLFLKCDGNVIDSWGTDSDLSNCGNNIAENTWVNVTANITTGDCTFGAANVIRFEGEASQDGEQFWMDCINITSYDSTESQQFEYIAGTGWQVNVTVPNFTEGLKNLFLNATYSGDTTNDTQTNAIDYGGIDTTAPTWSLNQTNNTVADTSTMFSLYWDDNTALHPGGQYIFSTNNTGAWANESAVNFTTTPQWANVTKILNDTVGTWVGWRMFVTDNASNINNTEIFTLNTTSSDTCTYTSGNWEIDCSDNCIISSNVDVNGNNISIIGTGLITVSANITNYIKLLIKGTDSSNICRVRCSSGGCFKG